MVGGQLQWVTSRRTHPDSFSSCVAVWNCLHASAWVVWCGSELWNICNKFFFQSSLPSLLHAHGFLRHAFFSNVIRWRLLRTDPDFEDDPLPMFTLSPDRDRNPQQLEWLLGVRSRRLHPFIIRIKVRVVRVPVLPFIVVVLSIVLLISAFAVGFRSFSSSSSGCPPSPTTQQIVLHVLPPPMLWVSVVTRLRASKRTRALESLFQRYIENPAVGLHHTSEFALVGAEHHKKAPTHGTPMSNFTSCMTSRSGIVNSRNPLVIRQLTASITEFLFLSLKSSMNFWPLHIAALVWIQIHAAHCPLISLYSPSPPYPTRSGWWCLSLFQRGMSRIASELVLLHVCPSCAALVHAAAQLHFCTEELFLGDPFVRTQRR